jgi:KaiC/GvpD/RAD55 family RecA-like ATPase
MSQLDNALAGTTTDRHTLVVVRGGPRTGKSALLSTAASRWRLRGITVLSVDFGQNVAPWDMFGAGAVIEALRAEYTNTGDFTLARPVDAAGALCTEATYASPRDRSWLLARLSEAFSQLRSGPTVVVADNLDAVPHPALAPACQPGNLVVAACEDPTRLSPDRVIELSARNLRIS